MENRARQPTFACCKNQVPLAILEDLFRCCPCSTMWHTLCSSSWAPACSSLGTRSSRPQTTLDTFTRAHTLSK